MKSHDDFELKRALDALPRSIEPPTDFWPDIKPRLAARRRGWRTGRTGSMRIAASIALLAAGIAGFAAVRRTQSTWHLAGVSGAPSRVYRVGESLNTDDTSRATLRVANIGEVEIEPNTRVRLVTARATVHRLALDRGVIHARISAPPRLFFVETPSALAVDLGCAYDLEVDEQGNSMLHVTLGWVSFEEGGRESLVPAGMRSITRTGLGVGTPFADDAPEAMRRALIAFDFERGGDSALGLVLRGARAGDAITLWHLISRVDASRRAEVYDRLASLAPPPQGVTREAALRLDHAALRLWWETLPGSIPITSDWGKTLWRLWLKLTAW